mmetsp:Transcript_27818/g.76574  ORF Transcript_27818/g.76574 Transcript_27818/m.76574 type:complete len:360 (-) Transcript_27818:145-1224(-)
MEFRFGHFAHKRANQQGSFGLSDKNVTSSRQGFRGRSSKANSQKVSNLLDGPGDSANVVSDGHEGREEDDGRKDAEEEGRSQEVDSSVIRKLERASKQGTIGQPGKDEFRAGNGVSQERGENVGQEFHGFQTPGGTNHTVSKNELNKNGSEDGAHHYGRRLPGEEPRQTKEDEHAKERDHVTTITDGGGHNDDHDSNQEGRKDEASFPFSIHPLHVRDELIFGPFDGFFIVGGPPVVNVVCNHDDGDDKESNGAVEVNNKGSQEVDNKKNGKTNQEEFLDHVHSLVQPRKSIRIIFRMVGFSFNLGLVYSVHSSVRVANVGGCQHFITGCGFDGFIGKVNLVRGFDVRHDGKKLVGLED